MTATTLRIWGTNRFTIADRWLVIMDEHQQCMKSAALLFWLTGYCRHACLLHLWFDAGYFACEKKKQSCLQVKCQKKWWVSVRRIFGVAVCWLFAKDVWDYRRLKIRGWSSTLFGRQDALVVLVAERLEGGPVSSRVSKFPDVSAWRRVDQNAQRVVENHGFDGDWHLESLVTMGACLSSREDWVVL